MNAMYLVQGDHLPCAMFPQLFAAPPAPAGAWCQPRLVGPYVLVAPLARMHNFVQGPLQQMQHSQASSNAGFGDYDAEKASTQIDRIQDMLQTLKPHLQTCANVLLDLDVWTEKAKWENRDASKFRDDDFIGPFWKVSVDHKTSTDKIAIFHKSLQNIIKIIVDIIQCQKDYQTQHTSAHANKHRDEWEILKKHLTHLDLTLNHDVRNPSNGHLTNSVTFSMLTHETTWEKWIQGCIGDESLYKIWHFFATRMAIFCNLFVEVLNALCTDDENWIKCVEKILLFCRHADWGTDILDKLRKVDNMSEKKLRKHVKEIQDTLEIPSWLRIDVENLQLEKVKRYAKDLLIAPQASELEKLYKDDRPGLIMCIHAMEDQNNVPEADRKNIDNSLLRDKKQLIEYARKHKPSPKFADLESMNRGTLEATVIRMLRDLCMLATERPNLEELSVGELVSYGESLLAKYPCEKFPTWHDHCGIAVIRRLAFAVHLPDDTLAIILAMPTKSIPQHYNRYIEVEKLKSSYHEISFYSRTASRLGVQLWSDIKQYTIRLQTGICNEQEGVLDLTISQYNPKHSMEPLNVDMRFSLTTKLLREQGQRRNVTQFMEVTFDYEDFRGGLYCLLSVHDPAKETNQRKENSEIRKRYYIPYQYTSDPTDNQEARLRDFLHKCATKIGQPKRWEAIGQNLNTQVYRACDAERRKHRMKREMTSLALDKALDGNDDAKREIMKHVD